MLNIMPFIVRVRLGSPVLIGDNSLLTLDSILAAILFRRNQDVDLAHSDIPLKRSGVVWHGSAFFPVEAVPYGIKFKADVNPVLRGIPDYVDAPRSILRVGGPDKPSIDEFQGFEASEGVWFGCGDIESVRLLLDDIDFVGKKGNQGFGAVTSFTIEPMTHDRSLFLPNNTLARNLPLDSLITKDLDPNETYFKVDRYCYEPPYWNTEQQVVSALPVVKTLQKTHVDFSDDDMPVLISLDDTVSIKGSPTPSGVSFFHEHVGHSLHSTFGIAANPKGASASCNGCGSTEDVMRVGSGYTSLCPVCLSFSGTYVDIKRPGRMGAGWFGLVKPKSSTLVTSYNYAEHKEPVPFASMTNVDLRMGAVELGKLMWDLVTNPPAPPYLFFTSGNSSINVIKGLKVTWSNDRCYISGNDQLCVDLSIVKKALDTWRKSGLTPAILNSARYKYDRTLHAIDAKNKSKSIDDWNKVLTKKPELEELLKSIPSILTDEFTLYVRVSNWEAKNV